jgi:glycosyltransferase involved in cell wall biosynthesis
MTDQYVAAGVAPREKFVTVNSGMEVEPFLNPPRPRDEVRRELGFAPEHVVVGKVARLFELKGHEFVIAAARTVVEQNASVRFLFVGDGLLRGQLEADIACAGLSDKFVFTGLVPPARVAELIAATDIVVHASLREGLARVLPQALIAGRPVVSYDIDGAREVVLPAKTGFLLPPRSVTELAEAIVQLSQDPAMRERMGQTGRARFTDQFRHETMVKKLRDVYEQVLAERSVRELK